MLDELHEMETKLSKIKELEKDLEMKDLEEISKEKDLENKRSENHLERGHELAKNLDLSNILNWN